jgi:ceramide synthetase
MLLHDVSDVFLESAKLCKYGSRETAADLLFGGFMLSWAVLRLYYFPFVIVQHVV